METVQEHSFRDSIKHVSILWLLGLAKQILADLPSPFGQKISDLFFKHLLYANIRNVRTGYVNQSSC